MHSPDEPAWDIAREIAATSFKPLGFEDVGLAIAVGRVLTMDAPCLINLPAYETSAMDGWVVAGNGPWKIVGEILAGTLPTTVIQNGQCLKIATGCVLPQGADSVLRWERAKEENGFISGPTTAREDIRPAGLESKKGEILISAGTKLTPTMVGLLAASGYDAVEVSITPRVALLILGDELMHSGLPVAGKVRDSLGIQIPALLHQLGANVVATRFIEDTLAATLAGFKNFLDSVDLLVTTGGTADGPRDHIHATIEQLGGIYLVDRVKSRPGHPMLLAELEREGLPKLPILGLPGNPQSCVVALLTLGEPVINSLLSKTRVKFEEFPNSYELTTSEGFNRMVAGNIVQGRFVAAQHLGSAMLRGLANSTGFAILSSGVTKPGDLIRWLPLP